MLKKIFIDGSAGTTGLRIRERLSAREDISIIQLPEEKRKDINARKEAINSADIAFLCLPDAAAIEAVSLLNNDNTVIIDTSTAHRTNPSFAYGFPELSSSFYEKIKISKRIAVPGCHASGFIALIYPLIEKGIISPDALLSATSLTGYSGGGKQMIADYNENKTKLLSAPRQYGISQNHKHLPEMTYITGISNKPAFLPIVANFYSGMEVSIPIFKEMLQGDFGIDDIKKTYKEKYKGPVVFYKENSDEGGFLSAAAYSGKDSMEISVFGNEDRILLTARYDNLGKGASGAAVECMNIVLGVDETKGLEI
jgi:N-acetyl-gamma-glutamyl-phosphate reductase